MSADASRGLVVAEDLEVRFASRGGPFGGARSTVRAVDGVDLVIERGECVGLVGESGSGKSTLGRALLRLTKTTRGTLRFDGQDVEALGHRELRRLRRRMQIVYQDPYSSLDPRMTVSQLLAEPLAIHGLFPGRARKRRVEELLDLVALPASVARRYPHEFSGGQRQRIGIAQALAVEPEFIVCDEPVSALDISIQAQIINLLMDLRDQLNLTYLFIGHNLDTVRHISDRVLVMYLGKVVEAAATTDLYESPRHPYTRALLSSSPLPDPVPERERTRIVLHGDPPSPADVPDGCRFRPRCWLYESLGRPERCRAEEPVADTLDDAHAVACHFGAPEEPQASPDRRPDTEKRQR